MPKSKDKVKRTPLNNKSDGAIEFCGEDPSTPIIAIRPNGDFYVKGKLKTTDIEIYKGINILLKEMNK